MGTPEQKARRAAYADKSQKVWDAALGGKWTDDNSLREYLKSIGAAPDKALFNQFGEQGGYSRYGPSWDPGWKNDFVTNERIPHQGPGETWYDPSVASNWQKTPQLQADRMKGFFDWNDKRGAQGNGLIAWMQGRANSSRPNAPDMAWFNEGTQNVTSPTTTATSTPAAPTVFSSTTPVPSEKPVTTAPTNPAITGTPYGTASSIYGRPSQPSMVSSSVGKPKPTRSPAWYSSPWKF